MARTVLDAVHAAMTADSVVAQEAAHITIPDACLDCIYFIRTH